jgi:hypothetical protein
LVTFHQGKVIEKTKAMNDWPPYALKTTLNAGLSNSLPFLKDQKRNKKVSRCRCFCNNADFPHLTQSKPFRLPVYLNLSVPRRAGTSGLLTLFGFAIATTNIPQT